MQFIIQTYLHNSDSLSIHLYIYTDQVMYIVHHFHTVVYKSLQL